MLLNICTVSSCEHNILNTHNTSCSGPKQCYFLLSASPEHPILYYVDRLRDGRSYATRFVRAVQRGKIIFILMCSFHKPEPEHPIAQWQMPADAPMPEELELDIDFYRRRLLSENPSEAEKSVFELVIRVSRPYVYAFVESILTHTTGP